MLTIEPDLSGVTNVIIHATAPAFLLGAVASFISILMARFERIMDRRRNQIDGSGDPLRLVERAALLHSAIYFAALAGLATAALLVLAFMLAFFGANHAYGVGLMFMLALILLIGALIQMTREVHIASRVRHLD
ncbi:MAG: DUF2721 domain-containing protein [Beijerinckiaceae bacterium]|nr:DUF2721 domain-containing protein [Beijerinckiaceae bacterium]